MGATLSGICAVGKIRLIVATIAGMMIGFYWGGTTGLFIGFFGGMLIGAIALDNAFTEKLETSLKKLFRANKTPEKQIWLDQKDK
jgi:hypothetical protein